MWPSSNVAGAGDQEPGGVRLLYPMMLEAPELRWAFIRKIYSMVSIQMILTVAVAASVRSVSRFFAATAAGLGLSIFLVVLPFMLLFLLQYYCEKHPVNLILLGAFTVAISLAVRVSCAFTSGKVILEAAILTTVVVVSLTVYTFWAVMRGQDFTFISPFLFGTLMVLFLFALIQILFPLGKISAMIYGVLGAIIFCGYIVYDTDNLIKRYSYDEYVWASASLYLDSINLFLSLLAILRAADR